MLCRRSASLMSTTRMSLRHGQDHLAHVLGLGLLARVELDPVQLGERRRRSRRPGRRTRARTSSSVSTVSSTTSWSRAAWSVTVSIPRSATMVATATGCSMKSSPDSRFWPSWDASAKTYAAWMSLRSTLGLWALTVRSRVSRDSDGWRSDGRKGRRERIPPRRSVRTASCWSTGPAAKCSRAARDDRRPAADARGSGSRVRLGTTGLRRPGSRSPHARHGPARRSRPAGTSRRTTPRWSR